MRHRLNLVMWALLVMVVGALAGTPTLKAPLAGMNSAQAASMQQAQDGENTAPETPERHEFKLNVQSFANATGLAQSSKSQSRKINIAEMGLASWYGYPYHGRKAADGSIYDKGKLTAAHRSLPFGTRTRVTNLRNHRSVTVRITDRGPFVDKRVVDLSETAAVQIGMLKHGIAPVLVEKSVAVLD